MLRRFNPPTVHAPGSNYSHGVEAGANMRWLSISGQIGVAPDGTIPPEFEKQAEIVWDNLLAVLADAGMGVQDLVKVTTFLTRKDDIPASRAVRERKLGGVATASTLLVVAGLASPAFLIEVEATAAKA